MTCKEIDNLLPAYEEGILTPEEKKGVEAHLAACERCRRSLADFRRSQELLRGLGEVEPPPFFEARIMARVRQEAGRKRGLLRRLFYPLHIKIPIQALAMVLVSVLAFHLYQRDSEMKRVAPLPVPLIEATKEPAAVEPPGATAAPEAVVPARPPAGDLPGAATQQFAAPPPEGSERRERMAESAAVREEHPADAIRKEPRAPEAHPPERMAKTASPETAVLGSAEEGAGLREAGRSEEAPGSAARGQELNRALARPAPAGPTPERRAKAAMADAATAAGERRPVPAAPAPGQAAVSGEIGRSVVELTIHVVDVHPAVQEVEKRLGEVDARIIERLHRGEGEYLRVEMAAERVAFFLGRLAAIGRMNVEKGLPGLTEGTAAVGITIERRP